VYTGVQFTGTVASGQSHTWFTWGWNPAKHVVWYVMPRTPKVGAPELNWTVQVERGDPNGTTYWITVKNLTTISVEFEGRYAVLN
jgi:hypothetical protein